MKFALTTAALLAVLIGSASSQGTELGNGVTTRVNVDYLAALSLDVRDMRQFLTNENGAGDALDVYNNGRNSEKRKSIKYALRSLNQELAREGSAGTPNYMFHLYGLSDRSTDPTKLNNNAFYADSFITQATQAGGTRGPDAVVALIMWIYGTHLLMDGFDVCNKMAIADNPGQFHLDGGGMDEFIALWIGSDTRHSLYGLAQTADAKFAATPTESNANKNIKLLYQEGAALLSVDTACTRETPDSPRRLWTIAHQIIAQMNIPLMQMLIDAIAQQDAAAVQLYALAVVPQVSQCRPSVFKKLNEALLVGNVNFQRSKIILDDLQSIYPCLGFTCQDIGTYTPSTTVDVPMCPNPLLQPAMAQYTPTSAVHPVSRIDLDVLQLRILTSLERFRFAKYLYEYGRNSPVQRDSPNDPFAFYSLADFAVSTSRKNADPIYTNYVEYYNNPNYADDAIRKALDGQDKWASSISQRSVVVAETAAFHVLYLHAIAQINEAVSACRGEDTNDEYDLTHPWDEVAALLIGSLEGPSEGGSPDVEDGQLVWSLANRRAFQFQTTNSKGYSQVGARLEDLLFAGRGEIDAENCDNLERTGEQIKSTIMIPLLQSIIRYAIDNVDAPSSSGSQSLALGEVYALAAIPIIRASDENAASVLEENMIVNDGIPLVRDGAQTVASAAGAAAVAVGMECSAVGSTSQVDACSGNSSDAATWTRVVPFVTCCMSAVAVLFVL